MVTPTFLYIFLLPKYHSSFEHITDTEMPGQHTPFLSTEMPGPVTNEQPGKPERTGQQVQHHTPTPSEHEDD